MPEPEEGAELTPAQKVLLDEGPKELYADLGALPRLSLLTAAVSGVAGALIGWVTGLDWLLLLLLPLAPIGTLLAVVDFRTRLLPRDRGDPGDAGRDRLRARRLAAHRRLGSRSSAG